LASAMILAGAFPVTDDQRVVAADWRRRVASNGLELERVLLRVTAELDRASLPFRLLKGAALAHADYPDPTWRTYADIDIVVPGDRFADALAHLGSLGGERRFAEIRPGFDARFGKGATMVLPDGTEIDVHRVFCTGPYGLSLVPGDLFDAEATIRLGARQLPVLEPAARLLHAALHSLVGDVETHLQNTRDIVQVMARDDLDVDRVLFLAERWRYGAPLAFAMDRIADVVAPEWAHPLRDWAVAHRPTATDARVFRAYTGRTRSYARAALAGVRFIEGRRNRFDYVRGLVAPVRAEGRRPWHARAGQDLRGMAGLR
jgi:hypothetical protein